jgi:hypothetical protein
MDSYHLLFHGKILLSKLYEKLMPTGRIYVLDRRAKKLQARREASHRREILPKTVEQEMTESGFSLWFRGPRLAQDRFLLVFGKAQHRKALSEDRLLVPSPRNLHTVIVATSEIIGTYGIGSSEEYSDRTDKPFIPQDTFLLSRKKSEFFDKFMLPF